MLHCSNVVRSRVVRGDLAHVIVLLEDEVRSAGEASRAVARTLALLNAALDELDGERAADPRDDGTPAWNEQHYG